MAFDTLSVEVGDPSTITVSAQSSATVQLVDVTLEVMADNEQPTAAILDMPAAEQQVNKVVTFDGTLSTDPDGQITCYQWEINSDIDANDEILQGIAASGISKKYDEEQELTVWLRVSDRGDAGSLCDADGAPVPETMFSPNVAILPYTITCANDKPVADVCCDVSKEIGGPPIEFDGCNSTDDGTIDNYDWNCGGGRYYPHSSPCKAWCEFTSVGTYTVRLTVWDDGVDGRIDPETGTFECQKSDTDEVEVVISHVGGS
jgi:hypothetical protein